MTNEFRTLLLNSAPWTGLDRPPGEEYVPADYVVRRLTPVLTAARNELFGPGADRAGMNLTLARLLAYTHASALFADVTANDARITYDPAAPSAVFGSIGPAATGPDIVGWSGTSGFAAAGRAHGSWTAVADGAGNYTVTPTGGANPESGAVVALDAGDAVPLPGSLLRLVVPSGADGTWAVALLAAPTHSFTALADLPGLSSLFRPSAGGSETVWFQTWSGNGSPALRAAAVALALAARTAELGS